MKKLNGEDAVDIEDQNSLEAIWAELKKVDPGAIMAGGFCVHLEHQVNYSDVDFYFRMPNFWTKHDLHIFARTALGNEENDVEIEDVQLTYEEISKNDIKGVVWATVGYHQVNLIAVNHELEKTEDILKIFDVSVCKLYAKDMEQLYAYPGYRDDVLKVFISDILQDKTRERAQKYMKRLPHLKVVYSSGSNKK